MRHVAHVQPGHLDALRDGIPVDVSYVHHGAVGIDDGVVRTAIAVELVRIAASGQLAVHVGIGELRLHGSTAEALDGIIKLGVDGGLELQGLRSARRRRGRSRYGELEHLRAARPWRRHLDDGGRLDLQRPGPAW